MKKTLLSLFCIFICFSAIAQKKITERFYSNLLKDTIYYNVFVPEDWTPNKKLPVCYNFTYGAVDGATMAAQLHYFKSYRLSNIPDVIVVTIEAGMDRIGFQYKNGLVAEMGLDFIESIKKEIIPKIEKTYNTSTFRTYVGHSYGASYASYLMQFEPQIFKSYILLAPERVGGFDNALPPPFELSEKVKNGYKNNKGTGFCYIGTGEFDDQRRREYVVDLSNALKKNLDSNNFFVKQEVVPTADHMDIFAKAFLNGVKFVYKAYDPYYDLGSDSFGALQKAKDRISNIYGLEIEKNQDLYKPFLLQAVEQKDSVGFLKIIDFFHTDSSKSFDLYFFGNFCRRMNLIEHAQKCFEQGIKLSLNGNGGPKLKDVNPLDACYGGMADVFLKKKDLAKAWSYLEKSVALGNIPQRDGTILKIEAYYAIAQFAFDNKYKIKEGLAYLKKCEDLRKRMQGENHWNLKYISFLMSKGYILINDKPNAKLYLLKALEIDPNYKEAKEQLDKLSVQ